MLILFVFLVVNALLPLIYNQTIDLVGNFPKIFSSLKDWINNLFNNFDSSVINTSNISNSIFSRLDEFSNSLSTSLPSIVINGISAVASSVGSFIIGLVIGFYLLISCNNIGNNIMDFIPRRYRKNIITI